MAREHYIVTYFTYPLVSVNCWNLANYFHLFGWVSLFFLLSSFYRLYSIFDFRLKRLNSNIVQHVRDNDKMMLVMLAGSKSYKIEYCLYIIIVEERRERKEIVHVQRSWIHPLRIERMADRTISLMRTKLLYKSIEFQLVWLIVEL